MRIVFNTNVTPSSGTGIGQYIEQLTDAIYQSDREIEMLCCVDAASPDRLKLPPYARLPLPYRPTQSFTHFPYLPWLAKKIEEFGANVYHLPNSSPLPSVSCATVVTIPDLQEYFIKKYSVQRTLYRKLLNRWIAHKATAVVTISEHSKRTIIEKLGVNPDKMFAIPLGRTLEFQPSTSQTSLVSHPYLLSVGLLQPGKNYLRLLEAFAQIRTANLRLVIVGAKGWNYEPILARAEREDLKDFVTIIHWVNSEDLVRLYTHALLVVYPSLYEGFGLPALEAMSCGAPVAAANNSSLPEVIGEAGVYFDPYSTAEIAQVVSRLLNDPTARAEMSRLGKERAKLFDWTLTAAKTIDVYKVAASAYSNRGGKA